MSVLRGIYRFVYDFIVGDDWKIAVAVVASLGVGAVLLAVDVSALVVLPVTGALVALVTGAALVVDVRRGRDTG